MNENLNKIQIYVLNIYKYLKDLCEKNGIIFYAQGGTLLGTIRHKGFIPWDDDMDICMDEYNFEKLKNVSKNDNNSRYKIVFPFEKKSNPYHFAKCYDMLTLADEIGCKEKTPLFVDIFVYKKVVDDFELLKKITKKYQRRYALLFYKNIVNYKDLNLKKKVKYFVSKLIPYNWIVTSMKKIREKYPKGNKMVIFGYTEIYIDDTFFSTHLVADFEDTTIYIFKNYDFILKQCYGNYMELPPINERVQHHYLNVEFLDEENKVFYE